MFVFLRSERGQSTVEFAGTLPFALLAVLVCWQLALAGHAVWVVGNAARVGARAEAVGGDERAAAASALPSGMRRGLSVRVATAGRVRVRARVPLLLPGVQGPFTVSSSARLEAGGP